MDSNMTAIELINMPHWSNEERQLFNQVVDKAFNGEDLTEDEEDFRDYFSEQLENVND